MSRLSADLFNAFGRVNAPEFDAAKPPIILAKGKLAPAGALGTGLYASHGPWLDTRHGNGLAIRVLAQRASLARDR